MIWRSTSAHGGGDWPDTTSSETADERWNRGSSWTSTSGCRLESPCDDETPEVVELRRLIAEQDAMLNERRQRIAETEERIQEYER